MFFKGVFLGDEKISTVFIKKFQKNVRKHYLLLDIDRQERTCRSESLIDGISSFYNAPENMIKKRIYSQDGRPTKTVFASPGIIIGFHGEKGCTLVEKLRGKNIRTETVVISQDGEGIKEEEYNRGLGRNFYLHWDALLKKLAIVIKQNRLVIENETMASSELLQVISVCAGKEIRDINDLNKLAETVDKDLLTALSLPIWFRETVKYARAYSA